MQDETHATIYHRPGGVLGLTNRLLLRSNDATSWDTVYTTDGSEVLSDLLSVNGRFVVVGRKYVLTSTDGLAWTRVPLPERIVER
jgi:hypothetical protein